MSEAGKISPYVGPWEPGQEKHCGETTASYPHPRVNEASNSGSAAPRNSAAWASATTRCRRTATTRFPLPATRPAGAPRSDPPRHSATPPTPGTAFSRSSSPPPRPGPPRDQGPRHPFHTREPARSRHPRKPSSSGTACRKPTPATAPPASRSAPANHTDDPQSRLLSPTPFAPLHNSALLQSHPTTSVATTPHRASYSLQCLVFLERAMGIEPTTFSLGS